MAPEASAARRAHDDIKALILAGKLGVRTRIDVEQLARALGLSSMPVRQALSVLAYERLVRAGEHAGYEVMLWSAKELAQLYAWRADLIMMLAPWTAASTELARLARTQPYAEAVFNVMRLLEADANPELQRAAINADERLYAARQVESEVLGDVEGEFENLTGAIAVRSKRVRTLLKSYYRRRIAQAGALRERAAIKALPQNGV